VGKLPYNWPVVNKWQSCCYNMRNFGVNMKIIKAHNLACPIDGKRLESHEMQMICGNGHAFDMARQGYVNLLLVQHKRSKQPGDSKEMVDARTDFLNSGAYEPIASKLAEIIFAQTSDGNSTCILDAGCGEGYYLDAIINELKGDSRALSFIGLDISKDAIIGASKRNKQITWIVGTNIHPPVEEASVDIILCVFGFRSFDGFKKTLKPGGKIILVDPGPDHLNELREIIYLDVKKSDSQDSLMLMPEGLSLLDSKKLQFKISVNNNRQLQHLFLMTPHFYRASKNGREAVENIQELDLTVDVVFRVLQMQ